MHQRWDRLSFLNWGELLVAILASLGVLSFSLLTSLQVFLIIALSGLVYFLIGHFYLSFREGWPSFLQEITLLKLVRVFVFFFATITLFKISNFYNLGLVFLFLSFGILAAFYFYMYLAPVHLVFPRGLLYTLLLVLVSEQLLWILYAWQRGVYFSSFVLTVVYYVYLEYITAYAKGRLTARLLMEYFVLGAGLIFLLSIIDWFKNLG